MRTARTGSKSNGETSSMSRIGIGHVGVGHRRVAHQRGAVGERAVERPGGLVSRIRTQQVQRRGANDGGIEVVAREQDQLVARFGIVFPARRQDRAVVRFACAGRTTSR